MRVLFVDDESSVRELLAAFCQYLEISYATAGNAEEALRLLEREMFSLIVTDVEMPGMSGVRLASEVRKLYPEIGVFVFSGVSLSPLDAQQSVRLFDKVFHKPEDYSRLIAEVMKYLAIRQYPFLA